MSGEAALCRCESVLADMLSLLFCCEPEPGPAQSLVPQPGLEVLFGHELLEQKLRVWDCRALYHRPKMAERRRPDEDWQNAFARDVTHKGTTQFEGANVFPTRIDALDPKTATDNPLRKYARKDVFVLKPVLRPLGHDFPEPIALDEVGRDDFHEG